MTALRIFGGIIEAVLLWALAAFALQGFEGDVRVLRPWQRKAFGVAAFVAGVCLIARGVWW